MPAEGGGGVGEVLGGLSEGPPGVARGTRRSPNLFLARSGFSSRGAFPAPGRGELLPSRIDPEEVEVNGL
jgi:hypothetical protein